MPAWFWFVVALLAAGGGALLLLSERSGAGDRSRGRRRWAEQKSWEFVDADPVLPGRWHHGATRGGHGTATALATGAVPGPGGRRLAHVFDLEQDGTVVATVAAVRGVATVPVPVELRLPSAPSENDAGLDSCGQLGERYAFVGQEREARPVLTDDVARAADALGGDVPIVWAEDTWVLASTAPSATPERMQEVLQALVGVSAAVEDAVDVAEGRTPRRSEEDTDVHPVPTGDGFDDRDDDEDRHDEDRHDEDRHDEDRHDEDRHDEDRDRRDDDRLPRADEDDRATDVHHLDDLDRDPDRDPDHRGAPRAAGTRPDDEYDYDDVEIDDLDDLDEPGRDTARPAATAAPTGPATHRDRPGDVPYDVEAESEREAEAARPAQRPGLRGVRRF